MPSVCAPQRSACGRTAHLLEKHPPGRAHPDSFDLLWFAAGSAFAERSSCECAPSVHRQSCGQVTSSIWASRPAPNNGSGGLPLLYNFLTAREPLAHAQSKY
jgi:hypothetical protein